MLQGILRETAMPRAMSRSVRMSSSRRCRNWSRSDAGVLQGLFAHLVPGAQVVEEFQIDSERRRVGVDADIVQGASGSR